MIHPAALSSPNGLPAPQGMAIFDSSGRLAECSAEFAQLLGEPPQKLLGRAYEELPLSSGNLAASPVREAQETGKATSRDLALGKAFLRISAQPLLTREGAFPHVAVTLTAVEQEQAPQERLQQLETELARFRTLFEEERRTSEYLRAAIDTLFDAVPAGMALFDDRLRYIRVNRALADANGLPIETHIGRTPRELLPNLDPHPEDLFRQILTTGVTNTIEVTGKTHVSDELGTWLMCTAPVRAPAGHYLGVAVVIMDITLRKRAEAERDRLIVALERSNRELDQFAYVASHDLKAPLRGITNLAQWIEDDLKSIMTEETRKQMRLLTGRIHRLEALINGILAYSRAGRVREQPESVDVGALLTETIELLSPAPPASIRVETHMPLLHTERVPFQQVFLNLISNALKHSQRQDALVRVGCSETSDGWEFSIADNGPGIAPEYHERIWGIFQTLRPRDEVEGTGIGLSVVKKIVEARGGAVRVESAVDQGATFFFTWPKTLPKK